MEQRAVAFVMGCENVCLEYPTKRVFDSLTLGIQDGDRIGIVGANGDGKSTLLSLLGGGVVPDSGRVLRSGMTTTSILRQDDSLDSTSTVVHAIFGDVPEFTWASDPRIRDIIGGILRGVELGCRVGELSGGQRRRVDLARVLVQDAEVLLLDEPTNHLDMHAISWLAGHLKRRWPEKSGVLLVVTHDRWFLDEVCSSMWEVHSGGVDQFEGGYSAYVLQRVERIEAARSAEQKRRNLMRKELAWLSRGPQARSTKPKFRVDAAHALVDDEPPLRNSIELKRTAMSRLGKQVVDLLGVTATYDGAKVLDDVTWLIGPGDRYGILGENGSGKTTLINLLTGVHPAASGQVKVGKTVKFAVLSQHLDELRQLGDERVRELLSRHKARYEIDGKEISAARLLERLGFESAQLNTPICDLSGGQKRRLQLMLVLLDKPNVLVLDEPDNDLDIDMLAAVESLLDTWPGTLLLITHDRYLMERVTDHQFALFDGKVRHVPGGVDEYLRLVDARHGASNAPAPGRTGARLTDGGDIGSDRRERTLSSAEERELKKALRAVERKLSTLGQKADTLATEMTETDPTDYVALGDVQARSEQISREIALLEDEWIEISERLS